MANDLKGQVPVTVGGRELVFNFSVDGVIQLEKRLGLTSREIGALIAKDDSVGFLRTWLWGALREHHAEINERDAGELLREDGSAAIALKLLEAWSVSWPVVLEEAEGDAPPPTRPTTAATGGTGKRSSAAGASSASGRRRNSGGKPRAS